MATLMHGCFLSRFATISNTTGELSPLGPPDPGKVLLLEGDEAHCSWTNENGETLSVRARILADVFKGDDELVSFQYELNGDSFTQDGPLDWCTRYVFRQGQEADCDWKVDLEAQGEAEQQKDSQTLLHVNAYILEDVLANETTVKAKFYNDLYIHTREFNVTGCRQYNPDLIWTKGPFQYVVRHSPRNSILHAVFSELAQEYPNATASLLLYWDTENTYWQARALYDAGEADFYSRRPTPSKGMRNLKDFLREKHPLLQVYSAFDRYDTFPVDDKYELYKNYRNSAAEEAFPVTYGSIEEALRSTSDPDALFFIKAVGGSRGEGIRVVPRSDLVKEPEPRHNESYVYQRAVTDLLTVDDPQKILHGRRFDIRFFVLVHKGKVYLHSHMWARWYERGVVYDPLDPSVENQVPQAKFEKGGTEFKDYAHFRDAGYTWNSRAISASDISFSGFHPEGWRDAVVRAMEKAIPTLTPIVQQTTIDPSRYHLFGGDALILKSGKALLTEFNDWPDMYLKLDEFGLALQDYKLTEVCSDPSHKGSYLATPANAKGIYNFIIGYRVEILKDMVSLVTGLEEPSNLLRFREILPSDTERGDTCGASGAQNQTRPNGIAKSLQIAFHSLRELGTRPQDIEKGSQAWDIIESIIRETKRATPEDFDFLIDADPFDDLRSWFSNLYRTYLGKREYIESDAFFANIGNDRPFHPDSLTPWGRLSYERVRDLFDGSVDWSNRKHLIMLGCGAMPVEVMHIHERTSVPKLTAVDIDEIAVASVKKLREVYGWNRLEAVHGNGMDVDYYDADVVYVANLVYPKKPVLERIVQQVKPGSLIIVRDAVGVGRLFAESVVSESLIPPGLETVGLGGGHSVFHSRHVYLERTG